MLSVEYKGSISLGRTVCQERLCRRWRERCVVLGYHTRFLRLVGNLIVVDITLNLRRSTTMIFEVSDAVIML